MPRPPRCRRICGVPQVDTFCPNGCENTEPILLTLDEYEVIRLVDLEQQTHEQCAAQMDISRSTVQEIYESARSKIAACLAHGKPITLRKLHLPELSQLPVYFPQSSDLCSEVFSDLKTSLNHCGYDQSTI